MRCFLIAVLRTGPLAPDARSLFAPRHACPSSANLRFEVHAFSLKLRSLRASGFERADLAANRIDRKNEIDAVPAISPHTRFGDKLSRILLSLTPKRIYGEIAGRRSPFLCYPFEKPKKSLLILPDSSVFITIARLLHYLRIQTPYTAHIWGKLACQSHQFDPERHMPPILSPQMSPG